VSECLNNFVIVLRHLPLCKECPLFLYVRVHAYTRTRVIFLLCMWLLTILFFKFKSILMLELIISYINNSSKLFSSVGAAQGNLFMSFSVTYCGILPVFVHMGG
jgi:hypothetical protein